MSEHSSHYRRSIHANQHHQNQRPQLTQGPVRFVTANDGSKECLAVLVTDNLMMALNDIREKKDNLDTVSGPLQHTGVEIKSLEASLRQCQEALENNINPDFANDNQRFVNEQEPRLAKLHQRRQKSQDESDELERQIEGARAHVDWALETAMEEGQLLRPMKPYHPPDSSDIIDAYGNSSRQHSMTSMISQRTSLGSEQMRRREADEELSNCGDHLRRVQAEFNDREYTYYKQLAGYKSGLKDGTYDFSRTEFDRRMLAYGREITRDLIDAEEDYERAEARREALGVSSTCDQSYLQSRGYEESMSKDQQAAYVSSLDRSSIEAWRADVPMTGIPEESREVMMEDVDTGLVQISDSASAADDGQYSKMINRWQQTRGVFEGANRPRTLDIWARNVEDLDRRHSA